MPSVLTGFFETMERKTRDRHESSFHGEMKGNTSGVGDELLKFTAHGRKFLNQMKTTKGPNSPILSPNSHLHQNHKPPPSPEINKRTTKPQTQHCSNRIPKPKKSIKNTSVRTKMI